MATIKSHPSWVCGLKLQQTRKGKREHQSHPSWVCGLKLYKGITVIIVTTVTPFVGVWIETANLMHTDIEYKVTPFVGVWIET